MIADEKKYRALISFRSDLQEEILAEVKKAADNGEKITAPMIERIGRAVQEIHSPQEELPVPPILNEYTDDADDEDDEDATPAISNEEVLEAVAERVGEPVIHTLIRGEDHIRLGDNKVRKTVKEDMEDEGLRDVAVKLRDRVKSLLRFLDKLLDA